MNAEVLESVHKEPFGARIRRWAEVVMATRSEKEGPVPDYPLLGDEDIDRLVRIAVRLGNRSYNNGDGSNTWTKWLVTLCGGLALMGIGGGVMMYGRLTAIEAKIESLQGQLTLLEGRKP